VNIKIRRRLYDLTSPFSVYFVRLANWLVMRRKIKLVFIFGMSRSGTTFLGRTLSLRSDVNYLHEPVKALMLEKYKSLFKTDIPPFWDYVFYGENIGLKVHYLVMVVFLDIIFGKTKKNETLCIKPISMFDSVPQVSRAFPFASIVYIKRSPYGYIDSLIRQSQKDPNHKNRKFTGKALEDAVRDWKSQNDKMLQLFAENPGWHWVEFEALCKEPVETYRELYRTLDLIWDAEVQKTIISRTGTISDEYYGVNRDSQAQIDKWKINLSDDQIKIIQTICGT